MLWRLPMHYNAGLVVCAGHERDVVWRLRSLCLRTRDTRAWGPANALPTHTCCDLAGCGCRRGPVRCWLVARGLAPAIDSRSHLRCRAQRKARASLMPSQTNCVPGIGCCMPATAGRCSGRVRPSTVPVEAYQ